MYTEQKSRIQEGLSISARRWRLPVPASSGPSWNVCAHPQYSLFCLAPHLFVPPLAAQQSTGVLRGTVTDPSGASIPGAVVTATEAGGQKRSATTGNNGNYLFGGLQPWFLDSGSDRPRTGSARAAHDLGPTCEQYAQSSDGRRCRAPGELRDPTRASQKYASTPHRVRRPK